MKNKYLNIENEIIDRCRTGDSKAQYQLYKLYYKAMFNTSLRIINNKVEAEDVMQEAFLTAFEKMNTFSNENNFGAWLKRIVINRSIDYLKKKKMDFCEINEISENCMPEENQNLNENKQEKIIQIKQAMHDLPEKYRVVLSLYLFEGFDHEEISQVLNVTQSNSRTLLTRGKQKLLEKLA
ncbi:MAG: sigma-70 family RNA polymerase sigma factor [Bacteroidetes bacterium]|nr:sigma-70 family RNA polymerase sigma factor [Bacteroidota bacterium]MBT6685876.1 sigma-70 family RNA polymerase sigma factor [Bacteroidota bacterium]MBT7144060.1 sigma-70 family RNA polymerase sigma factor [Bacteroidota bacterium]MBT7490982.1 sigma-70 family RNA polymerase sigma factor [Bacteroidota bacterium]